VKQLSFLSAPPADPPPAADGGGEALVEAFRSARLAEGASAASVRREVSQLRALAREVGAPGRPAPLAALLKRPDLVAGALREPREPIGRGTGRSRLLAVQRFARIAGPRLGRDPAADLAVLDGLLPRKPSSGWHAVGVAVAGAAGRRRRPGPTLGPADLARIVEAAGAGSDRGRAVRDRALVALACYSGLRPEEIVAMRWEDLAVGPTPAGYDGLTARVARGGRVLRLLLVGPAREAVEAWAAACGGTLGALAGPVLPARGRPDAPLSYRAARDVLTDACARAGLPPATAAELRAGCAWWLRAQGLAEHEAMAVLGLARVRSVDRLLAPHLALTAQRRAREVLER
jgi:integrase